MRVRGLARLDAALQNPRCRPSRSQNTSLVVCEGGGFADPWAAAATAAASETVAANTAGLARGPWGRERAAARALASATCSPAPAFVLTSSSSDAGPPDGSPLLVCARPRLASGGDVLAGGTFTRFYGCACAHAQDALQLDAAAGGLLPVQAAASADAATAAGAVAWRLQCVDTSGEIRTRWRRAVVLVGSVPVAAMLLLVLFLR